MARHIINVDFLVAKTGLEGPVIRLLTCILVAYPLALLYGFLLYKKNPTLQHIFLTVCGIFLTMFHYGLEGLHTLVAIVVQYFLIRIVGPNSFMIILSFVFQMTYLIVGYFKYSTDQYDIAWTTGQCILVLRLLGVAWDTYDGAQDLEKASNDTKLLALRKLPGFLEMTGHAYFFGSWVVGPQFPMHRYLSFVHGTLIPTEHDHAIIKIKKGLARCAAGWCYLIVYTLTGTTFGNEGLVSQEFENLSLVYKFGYITIWGRVALCKYLGVWLIAEGSCIMTGLTYNGKTESGQSKWDALKNCKITIYETATTLQGLIDSFNVNTNMWMSRYLFKRLRFLGNKTLSHLGTLAFLAVWHGVYPGYFVCFMSEYMYITGERQLLTVTKTVFEKMGFTNSGVSWWIRSAIGYIVRNVLMSYCLMPFCLLTWARIYKVYYVTYALPHLLMIGWLVLYMVVISPLMKRKDLTKQEEREKIK